MYATFSHEGALDWVSEHTEIMLSNVPFDGGKYNDRATLVVTVGDIERLAHALHRFRTGRNDMQQAEELLKSYSGR